MHRPFRRARHLSQDIENSADITDGVTEMSLKCNFRQSSSCLLDLARGQRLERQLSQKQLSQTHNNSGSQMGTVQWRRQTPPSQAPPTEHSLRPAPWTLEEIKNLQANGRDLMDIGAESRLQSVCVSALHVHTPIMASNYRRSKNDCMDENCADK